MHKHRHTTAEKNLGDLIICYHMLSYVIYVICCHMHTHRHRTAEKILGDLIICYPMSRAQAQTHDRGFWKPEKPPRSLRDASGKPSSELPPRGLQKASRKPPGGLREPKMRERCLREASSLNCVRGAPGSPPGAENA